MGFRDTASGELRDGTEGGSPQAVQGGTGGEPEGALRIRQQWIVTLRHRRNVELPVACCVHEDDGRGPHMQTRLAGDDLGDLLHRAPKRANLQRISRRRATPQPTFYLQFGVRDDPSRASNGCPVASRRGGDSNHDVLTCLNQVGKRNSIGHRCRAWGGEESRPKERGQGNEGLCACHAEWMLARVFAVRAPTSGEQWGHYRPLGALSVPSNRPFQSFPPSIQRSDLVPQIRQYVAELRRRAALRIAVGTVEEDREIGSLLAAGFDSLLLGLFCWAVERVNRGRGAQGLSLAAVGSYGRCTLAYHSDLDVRVVTEDHGVAAALADELFYPLWDAGVTIGHQVVTVDEVLEMAQQDLATATSLLDWRLLGGEQASTKQLENGAYAGVFSASRVGDFVRSLDQGASERVERFGQSVYLLEPDVRNGPGGLRDFDALHWIARARWRAASARELVPRGVLLGREWLPVQNAHAFLSHVRNLLHLLSGRRNDRLTFDRQEQIAEVLGYGHSGPAVERFMSECYRHARILARARELIALSAGVQERLGPGEESVGGGCKVVGGQLALSASPEEDPEAALRLYCESRQRDVPVCPVTRGEIARATSSPEFCSRLRRGAEAPAMFVELCTVVARSPCVHDSVVGELHDVGLLTAMIPEFLPVVGRVHHDIYHVYTVDIHSIKAVDRLRALCRGELAAEFPVASHVAAEVARPRVLFLATLLHDVGKDIGGKNHSVRGAELVGGILARLGFTAEESAEVAHLVRHHLEMYLVATRRDIEEPSTLADFCSKVHGLEGLRELYLLTMCDVGTTSPESLTSWKARMLDELYLAARARLSEETVDAEVATRDIRARLLAHFDNQPTEASVKHFLGAMPERYLLANEVPALVVHARFVAEAEAEPWRVGVVRRVAPLAELAFLADDRPGLLAMIAASIAAAGVGVVRAEVYSFTDRHGRRRAFDLFWVEAGDKVTTGRTVAAQVEQGLRTLFGGLATGAGLIRASGHSGRWASRASPQVTTRVNVENRAARDETIIEVIARDCPGLLFELADTIQRAGLVISRAKINTEGHQVADVFYVALPEGGKLTDPLPIARLKESIIDAVGRGPAAVGGISA